VEIVSFSFSLSFYYNSNSLLGFVPTSHNYNTVPTVKRERQRGDELMKGEVEWEERVQTTEGSV
jgi:hypothetical protein